MEDTTAGAEVAEGVKPEEKQDNEKEEKPKEKKKKKYKTDEDLLLAFRFFDKNGKGPDRFLYLLRLLGFYAFSFLAGGA